tara:strand:+ start:208 stop:390 length:183 start_codon:yes stop_codon:yes gene_type:complete
MQELMKSKSGTENENENNEVTYHALPSGKMHAFFDYQEYACLNDNNVVEEEKEKEKEGGT